MIDFADHITAETVIKLLFAALIAATGWGVRHLMRKFDSFDKKFDAFRGEYKADLDHYVSKDTCQANCQAMEKRLDKLETVHGVVRVTEHGVAVVDINNPAQMHDLHELLTPEQRRAHAAQCQFMNDMPEHVRCEDDGK